MLPKQVGDSCVPQLRDPWLRSFAAVAASPNCPAAEGRDNNVLIVHSNAPSNQLFNIKGTRISSSIAAASMPRPQAICSQIRFYYYIVLLGTRAWESRGVFAADQSLTWIGQWTSYGGCGCRPPP